MVRLLCAALILAACGTTGDPMNDADLSLLVEPAMPQPGQTVTLTLVNRTSESVGYNLCTSTLLRQLGDDWIPVPSDRICTMELRILEANGEASFDLQLETGGEPGLHRFQANVERMDSGGMETVMSEPFTL